jgi:hypothetical protein
MAGETRAVAMAKIRLAADSLKRLLMREKLMLLDDQECRASSQAADGKRQEFVLRTAQTLLEASRELLP